MCTYTRMRLRHGRELLLEVLGLPAHVAQARLGALAWCICSATCTIRASIGRAARSARTRRHVAVHLPCTHATCTCMSVPARLPRAPPHLSAASVASLARAQTSETRLGRERRRLGDPPVAQAVQYRAPRGGHPSGEASRFHVRRVQPRATARFLERRARVLVRAL